MATLDRVAGMWRQAKRAISVGLCGAGVYLLWLSYTGDLQGPVVTFFGALLAGGGFVGVLFPSKLKFFEGSGTTRTGGLADAGAIRPHAGIARVPVRPPSAPHPN